MCYQSLGVVQCSLFARRYKERKIIKRERKWREVREKGRKKRKKGKEARSCDVPAALLLLAYKYVGAEVCVRDDRGAEYTYQLLTLYGTLPFR